LLLIGVIGGSLPFYLFFKGLSITPAVSGAIIHKTLIFWVALWAIPFLHEKLTIQQVLALGLVFGSSFIVGGITSLSFGTGEMMILAATILWAVENIIAKVALRKVDADVVVGVRMIFGSLLLFAATILTGRMSLISQLSPSQWGLTLTSIAFLTGYVMSWYRALREAPATLVATVLTLGAVITNVLSAVFITRAFKIELVLQTILLGAGVWLFWTASKKIPNYTLNVKSEHI
jgi:drug/metabolite transporter (DMT)-like permease